jgi:hypothetical protein
VNHYTFATSRLQGASLYGVRKVSGEWEGKRDERRRGEGVERRPRRTRKTNHSLSLSHTHLHPS